MRSTQAWDLSTGSPSTVAAIVDTGVGLEQPDLAPNVWINPGESGGGRESNGVDDDGDGLVDDWHGWNFARNTNDPHDTYGHGTQVAGAVGARGNDGYGVAGVNWSTKLMVLRAGLSNDLISSAAAAAAFRYAAAKGARVVNGSFGFYTFSQAMYDAVAASPATLFVFSAGNDANDNDARPHYPSSIDLPNVIAVAASDQSDALASFSNYGATGVDLAAPGRNVLSDALAVDSIFAEGFETGNQFSNVSPAATWAPTTAAAYSGSQSLSDSTGNYAPTSTATAALGTPINLAGRHNCQLDFRLRRDFGAGDGVVVEESPTGASGSYVPLGVGLGGSSAGVFQPVGYDISAYDGAPAVYLRFRIITNGDASVGDGAYIDNVTVHCYPAAPPAPPGVAYASGTSIAAPEVTGAAALLFSQNPFRSVADVRSLLLDRADRIPGLAGKVATGARLNIYQALRDITPPTLGRVTISPRRFAALTHGGSVTRARSGGGLIKTSLSEAGTVTFAVQRLTTGRRVGRACRAVTRRNRRRPHCQRAVSLRGTFSAHAPGGPLRVRFSGRLRGRMLGKGSYRLLTSAVDPSGNRSGTTRTSFSIKAPKRRARRHR